MKKYESVQYWDNNKVVRLFVYIDKGDIVGSYQIDDKLHRALNKKTVSFNWFYVHDMYRGRGIGKRMMKDMMKLGYPEIYCLVEQDNLSAQCLYAKFGFKYESEFSENNHYYWYKRIEK